MMTENLTFISCFTKGLDVALAHMGVMLLASSVTGALDATSWMLSPFERNQACWDGVTGWCNLEAWPNSLKSGSA
ncbi:uncharacterized protein LOC142573003 isoform X2 [Dermacentor variabilis]|uniref:uncharacterized protein LOC142573003 isoform X2 n=1 Tax=Dermacentor variabilis TaxID=34621 RepID=UPI003F5BD143